MYSTERDRKRVLNRRGRQERQEKVAETALISFGVLGDLGGFSIELS
jgi:hypothetical protein